MKPGIDSVRSGIDSADLAADIRPQDDLFGHVNAAWSARTEIPEDRARYGAFIRLHEEAQVNLRAIVEEMAAVAADPETDDESRKIGDLYASFMDEDSVERHGAQPLAGALARVDSITDTADLVRALGEFARRGVSGIFDFYVNTDDQQPDRYILNVVQSGLGLPDESYYRTAENAELRSQYVAHVERMLALADRPDPAGAAARVLALETRLAGGHWDRVQARDRTASYNLRTDQELRALTPALDWTDWARATQFPAGVLNEVIVRQPEYLSTVDRALREVPLADWQAWLSWHVIRTMAPYLASSFVKENFDFYGRTLSGTPQLQERWKRGVALVNAALPEALGKHYVARHFPPGAKARMDALVANLIEAYRQQIAVLPWMGDETKARALEKLAAFTPKIGHPDTWRDYSGLTIERGDLLANVARAEAFELDRMLAKIGQPIDRDEWFMPPQTVNAYYNPGMNEIVFPAAILQPPFFDAEADDAVNYGGIGAVIGHEIGHGFDDQGSKYDGTGAMRNWWTDSDRDKFDERTQALISQFNEFEALPGHYVNGELTVGENIGDLGGLSIAHTAYELSRGGQPAPVMDGLSGDQRFFLGWAQVWQSKYRDAEALRLLAIDPHSPPRFRVNGVVRNVTAFHDAFGVEPGDALYLPEEQRVHIW